MSDQQPLPSNWAKHAEDLAKRQVEGGGQPPHDGGMDARVSKLEDALQGINVTLARVDERITHLATKADVEKIHTRVEILAAKLDSKADKSDFALLDGQVRALPSLAKLSALAALTAIVVSFLEWGMKHF